MNYGIQLYSVRDITKNDFEFALKAVAQMGYTMVEPAGFFGNSSEDVAKMLDKYGLICPSTHTPCETLRNSLDETIKYHKEIGCKNIIIPSARFKTREELDSTIELINKITPILRENGLELHYHNHSEEFLPNADCQIAFDELVSRTDVLFEIDTFWAMNAGLDPVTTMEKYKERIRFIHLKDGIPKNPSAPESKPIGKSVGLGVLPAKEVIAKATELGITMIVESEDLDPNGLAEVKRCIDFLKSL